jgi:hypothetical protein
MKYILEDDNYLPTYRVDVDVYDQNIVDIQE